MDPDQLMVRRSRMFLALLTIVMLTHSLPVLAETRLFDVQMLGRTLGQITYRQTNRNNGTHSALAAHLNNTPLGVFDGVFKGVRHPSIGPDGGPANEYRVKNVSPKRTRVVSVLFQNKRVVQSSVTPPYQNAMVLDLDNAPLFATDMIDAFGTVAAQTRCPSTLRIYDGRRLIRVSTKNSQLQDKRLTCVMTYKVIKGPGHLHPFDFRSVGVSLTYETDLTGKIALKQINLKAGAFKISLIQKN